MTGRGQMVGMVGIGGSGMQGLARILAARGTRVVGSDDAAALPDLSDIEVVPSSALQQRLGSLTSLIYSDAVPAAHAVRQAAAALSMPQYSYAAALGRLSGDYTTLAVAGTHGKSSTTAMLGHILVTAGLDPTVLVGAPVPAWDHQHARIGASKYLVVEADEYLDHFLQLSPQAAIITAIDWDHPDFFADRQAVWRSFESFVRRVPADGAVLVPAAVLEGTRQNISWPMITRAVEPPPHDVQTALPGAHMQYNAWLAVQMAMQMGVPQAEAQAALSSFRGLGRRFEELGRYQGALRVISDYGHHPAEVAATLTAARQRLAGERVVVLFEPHTWSRLAAFGDAFAQVFRDGAWPVVVCPVYAAREEAPESADPLKTFTQALADADLLRATVADYAALPAILDEAARDFTAAVAFTAGTLDGHLRCLVSHE